MQPGVREELAGIVDQALEYTLWLKEDGVTRMDGSVAAAGRSTPARKAIPVATPAAKAAPAARAPVRSEPRPAAREGESLAAIAAEVAACSRCPLHLKRTHTVPGQGNEHPEILFVGEAPGADEDEQGLAFVGRAGQLLTKMIQAMGLTREEVFIANIAKCRPPDNRQPTPEEMETCLPFLRRQIVVLQPKVIIAMGAVAVRGLLQNMTGITKLRGSWQQLDGIDVMPTYHPAYLLRNPPSKKEAWADLQAVLKRLGRPIPGAKTGP